MLQKINIKILAGIFIVLLALVLIDNIGGSDKSNRSFKSQLANFNIDEVTLVELCPRSLNGKTITLSKKNNDWMVSNGEKSYKADQQGVNTMLNSINNLKAESLVASSKERWSTYEVNDSLSSKVKVYNNKKILADLVVGKIKFSQPQKISTYIRINKEKQTYSVNGFLSSSFNRSLDQLRDKTVIKNGKQNWQKLTFSYPADSSFVLEKKENNWMINNEMADSANVFAYLQQLTNVNSYHLSSEASFNNLTELSLTIENNDATQIRIYWYVDENDENNSYLTSSMNDEAFFNDSGTANKIFKSPNYFRKTEIKE